MPLKILAARGLACQQNEFWNEHRNEKQNDLNDGVACTGSFWVNADGS